MSHHLTHLRCQVFVCLVPVAKCEACESEASSDFHPSRFRFRLAYAQEAFRPLHGSSADHPRCLGRPGNCSNCWSTLWRLVVGGNAFVIFDLCGGGGGRPSSNIPVFYPLVSGEGLLPPFCLSLLCTNILPPNNLILYCFYPSCVSGLF